MQQLLRTYLIGLDRKFELYGDVDAGEKVTRVLEYAYLCTDEEGWEKSGSHWVCKGEVDISNFIDLSMNPQLHGMGAKSNDIQSIRKYCQQLANR